MIEQHARSRVSEHVWMGFHDGAHVFRLPARALCFPRSGSAPRWHVTHRIDAEIAQGLAPEAGIWHDDLHLVVGHQLGPEQRQLLDGADAAASRMFQNLGMVEIDFTSREIVREAIKFLRDAPQFPFQVLLGRFVRQSPGMIGLRVIVR